MPEFEPLLTITKIKDTYGVSRKTIQRWVDAGKLKPAQSLDGKTGAHLFLAEDAEKAFGPVELKDVRAARNQARTEKRQAKKDAEQAANSQ